MDLNALGVSRLCTRERSSLSYTSAKASRGAFLFGIGKRTHKMPRSFWIRVLCLHLGLFNAFLPMNHLSLSIPSFRTFHFLLVLCHLIPICPKGLVSPRPVKPVPNISRAVEDFKFLLAPATSLLSFRTMLQTCQLY